MEKKRTIYIVVSLVVLLILTGVGIAVYFLCFRKKEIETTERLFISFDPDIHRKLEEEQTEKIKKLGIEEIETREPMTAQDKIDDKAKSGIILELIPEIKEMNREFGENYLEIFAPNDPIYNDWTYDMYIDKAKQLYGSFFTTLAKLYEIEDFKAFSAEDKKLFDESKNRILDLIIEINELKRVFANLEHSPEASKFFTEPRSTHLYSKDSRLERYNEYISLHRNIFDYWLSNITNGGVRTMSMAMLLMRTDELLLKPVGSLAIKFYIFANELLKNASEAKDKEVKSEEDLKILNQYDEYLPILRRYFKLVYLHNPNEIYHLYYKKLGLPDAKEIIAKEKAKIKELKEKIAEELGEKGRESHLVDREFRDRYAPTLFKFYKTIAKDSESILEPYELDFFEHEIMTHLGEQ